ncbi:hypothetical protein ACFE04_021354 [Oxalis oulophora]
MKILVGFSHLDLCFFAFFSWVFVVENEEQVTSSGDSSYTLYRNSTPSQLALENAVNNPDEPIDNSQDVDLGGNDLARDDVNIDTLQDVAHPSRERHSSDPSNLGGDDLSHGNIDIDIPQDAAYHSKKRHSSDQLVPSIVLAVPCTRRIFRQKALLSPITEVTHDEEEAYSSSTYDAFLEEPSSIGIEGSSFIGFTTSSSSIDSVLTSMDVPNDTPSVPSSLPILVSPQIIISTTVTNTSSGLPKALVSASQLSSSCATALATTMSISHELPHMSLPLPPLSSLCTIASSTTLRTSSEFPIMPHSLSPLTSLCMTSPLTTSENTISSLVSAYPSSYVPPIVTLTQSTTISTPVTMLGSLVTCIPDVTTTLPRALLTQSLSTVAIPFIMSSSIIPSLSSSSASVFSLSTFAKAISEAMFVVAMTRDAHFDEEMEEENISRNNEIESLRQKVSKLESDAKQDEGDKDAKISSLERALARVRAFVSLSVEDLGNDVEPSNDP